MGDEIQPIRLHDMRHTNETLLERAGVSYEKRCFHIGHEMPGAAARYDHDDGDRAAVCAAIDSIIDTDIKRHDYHNLTNNSKYY